MLKSLKAHHRNIIQMSFNGFRAPEIAARLEIAPVTVSNVLRSPLGKAYMEGLTDKLKDSTIDVRKELVSMNKDALKTFSRLLNPENKAPASVQFSTAKDLLDRTGFKAPDKLNIDMTFQAKSDDEIDAEIEALKDSINRTNTTPVTNISQATELPTLDKLPTLESLPILKKSNLDNQNNMDDLQIVDETTDKILTDVNFDPFNNIKRVK